MPETNNPVGFEFVSEPGANPALLAINPVLPAVVLTTVAIRMEVALSVPLKALNDPKQLPEQVAVPPVNVPLVMDQATLLSAA